MKPVFNQHKHDPENGSWGDCQRACIASLLELPADAVPHFYEGGVWRSPRSWLKEQGYLVIDISFPGTIPLSDILWSLEFCNPETPFILGGHSGKYKCGHAVICCGGKIIHDPSGSGISGPMKDGLYWITYIGKALS